MPTPDQVAERRTTVATWYADAFHRYRRFEDEFAAHLGRVLRNAGLDGLQVSTRTKSPASLVAKAASVENDRFKYDDPRTEIRDFVGARIVVPLSTDVAPVARLLDTTYVVDERSERRTHDEEDVPGYQSLHLLVRFTAADQEDAVLRELGDFTVEVQVRTILQHAWAALQHDLMYKAERQPTPQVRRRLIALAGLLELADHEFVTVRTMHGGDPGLLVPVEETPGTLSAADVRALLSELLRDDDDTTAPEWFVALAQVLGDLGIRDADGLRATLGDWAEKGPDVAAVVRRSQPWASSAYVVDLLLRLALRQRYLAARTDGTPTRADLSSFEAELDTWQEAL